MVACVSCKRKVIEYTDLLHLHPQQVDGACHLPQALELQNWNGKENQQVTTGNVCITIKNK